MTDFSLIMRELLSADEWSQNEELSSHSSFKIGGKADLFAKPVSSEKLISLIRAAMAEHYPFVVVGGGSNILFSDKGFRGLVITTMGLDGIEITGEVVTVSGGVSMPRLAKKLQLAGLTGFEFASGIPGSVGGGVFMNAGAYDGEIANVLTGSVYYDCELDRICELPAEEHAFSYRHSSYMDHPERIILSAEFSFKNGNPDTIKAKCDDFLCRRREKQPLEYPSAGSTFKRYPGYYTAQMIDECGLKGFSIGGAQVSQKHAGFVINCGNASAADVLALIDHIKCVIKEQRGIDIECEIRFIGEKQ